MLEKVATRSSVMTASLRNFWPSRQERFWIEERFWIGHGCNEFGVEHAGRVRVARQRGPHRLLFRRGSKGANPPALPALPPRAKARVRTTSRLPASSVTLPPHALRFRRFGLTFQPVTHSPSSTAPSTPAPEPYSLPPRPQEPSPSSDRESTGWCALECHQDRSQKFAGQQRWHRRAG